MTSQLTMSKKNKSDQFFAEAKRHLVGGVNSPVRAYKAVGGTPLFIQKASGPYVYDVDGNKYIDFVGSWGPMILGHSAPAVINAVKKSLLNGTSFGAPTPAETELAVLIKEAFPSIDLLRFTNSGTEATMTALRIARAVTRRDRTVKFEGGYHGHSDGLLVAAGSGATTFGVPSSAGVPEVLARNTWVLPYNDVSALKDIFRTQGPNIAAVIVEPVAGNMGVVEPSMEFLTTLRELTIKHGAILIFDEVMTGFRVAWGGAQERASISADLTCLGKIIGGGFPVGAVGGRKDLMEQLSPLGPVYQAGTLSGNPIAMSAGLAALQTLKRTKPYKALETLTKQLVAQLRSDAAKENVAVQINSVGSMFTLFFTESPVTSYFEALQSDASQYAAFFHTCLKNGVTMPPSQFEAAFVSTAHTPAVLGKAAAVFRKAFKGVHAK